VDINARQVLLAVAVVAVVVAGGVFYFVNQSETADIPIADPTQPANPTTPTPPSADAGDLMTAGPLGDKTLGDPKAPNVVIEYASMTCTHCRAFNEQVFDQFKAKYIDTGKVYYILREFPLDPVATAAIMVARCAPGERFFPLVDLMFNKQPEWAFVDKPLDQLKLLVKQAGISSDQFDQCVKDQKVLDGVRWVQDRASKKFGVDSTPTFFINGEKVEGEQSLDALDKRLAG
jgi:protein-disulfide isomerase